MNSEDTPGMSWETDQRLIVSMGKRERFGAEISLNEEPGPNHGNLVWVQCREFRCLAFLDSKGNWINFYTGKKLNDFVKVIGR